jgi:hypothetical protein
MTILGNTKKTLPIAISSLMRVYTIEYGAPMIVVRLSAGLLGSVK